MRSRGRCDVGSHHVCKVLPSSIALQVRGAVPGVSQPSERAASAALRAKVAKRIASSAEVTVHTLIVELRPLEEDLDRQLQEARRHTVSTDAQIEVHEALRAAVQSAEASAAAQSGMRCAP